MQLIRNISTGDRARTLLVSGSGWGEIRCDSGDGTERVRYATLEPPSKRYDFEAHSEVHTPGGCCYVERIPESAVGWLDTEDLEIVGASEDLSWIDEITTRKRMAASCVEHGVKYATTEPIAAGRERLRAKLTPKAEAPSK